MRIGCHVSIAGGIDKSVGNAVERGCSAFQIFTRNPRGWRAKEITKEEAGIFAKNLRGSGIDPKAVCVHMPYLPNLSSTSNDSYPKSVATLTEEVERCGTLGIPYLVTHLGSHLGAGEEKGIERLVGAYEKAATIKNDVTILLENTAGQKNSVGGDFGQLGQILHRLDESRFGVCLDTCHAFAYGYDMRTASAVRKMFAEFEKNVGSKRLKILHLNDAKAEAGSKLDRHYHIGLGKIGKAGMRETVKTAKKMDVPVILETPIDDTRDDIENVKIAREMA